MKQTYLITLEGALPVLATLNIEADTESEAIMLAERVAESQKNGVKTTALAIEVYPADFLVLHGVADIMPFDSGDTVQKIWNRDQIEAILGE